MTKTIAIYCAGSLGKEIAGILRQETDLKLLFVDDVVTDHTVLGHPVYRFTDFVASFDPKEVELIIATGEPRFRRLLRQKVEAAGFSLRSYVSHGAFLNDEVKLGAGVFVFPQVYLAPHVEMADNAIVHAGAKIEDGCRIGPDSFISANAFVGAHVTAGREVFVGPMSACKDHLQIGSSTIIGMGAVLLNDTAAGDTVVGNPARVLRNAEDEKVFRGNHYLIDGNEL